MNDATIGAGFLKELEERKMPCSMFQTKLFQNRSS
jgi:hypothetical protein